MNWKKLLTTPPPSTCWSLDAQLAAVATRDGKGELIGQVQPLIEGAVEIGPVGLHAVNRELLEPALTEALADLKPSRRVAVVVPTGWIRTHLLDFEA